VKRNGAISALFEDFDSRIEPFLTTEYDHGMMIHVNDRLYDTLRDHMRRTGEELKLKEFDSPTPVENLAYRLFTEIK
jgi:6-pyruvoyltetrahydropterin/6-carboxytetrahydropterin synthase